MIPTSPIVSDDRLYTRRFFKVFGGVVLFMTGVALQFHFGQYVQYLGHGVDTLGVVLGVSMVGTLLIRLHIGRWIDRFGCRPTWIVGALVATLAAGAIQFTGQLWLIVVLRTITTMATAAVMTTVAVVAAHIAPPRRRAESLGSMGLGGFTGMIIGATLGDYIFAGSVETVWPYRVFFSTSAACSLLSGTVIMLISLPGSCGPARAGWHGRTKFGRGDPSIVSWYGTAKLSLDSATRPDAKPPGERDTPSTLGVIRTHWPGTILLIGVVFGMVFCLQLSFLERLAEARGFLNIKAFFLTYGPTAMILRIVFRRVPERIGRTRAVLGGMLLLGTGVALLIGVETQWGLIVPGLLMGAGHCFVFPSMVDLSAERLPPDRRGTGTSLILAAGDVGMLSGFVVLGEVIDRLGFDTALWLLVAAILTATATFAFARRTAAFGSRGAAARHK